MLQFGLKAFVTLFVVVDPLSVAARVKIAPACRRFGFNAFSIIDKWDDFVFSSIRDRFRRAVKA